MTFSNCQAFVKSGIAFKRLIVDTLGIDGAVSWTLVNTYARIIKGPLSVFFIVTFLTAEHQGLWYTFLSLGGMSVFAELGFTRIITRFVSHEYASVHMVKGVIVGSKKNLDSLFSLIRYSIRFYVIVIPTAIVFLCVVGVFFFAKEPVVFVAWAIFSVVMGAGLLLSLFQSIYLGLDKVIEVNKIIVLGVFLISLLNWMFLAAGANIWALVIGSAVGVLSIFVALYKIARPFWHQLRAHECQYKFAWFGKTMSLQWKYALSFVGGYIASQAYIPALYKIEGPVAAGQFGLTFTIVNMLISSGSAWLTSKTPKLNMLVAMGDNKALNQLFLKSVLRGYLAYIFGALSALALIWMLYYLNIYSGRFLSVGESGLLFLGGLASIKVGFIAEYVRAQKAEPYYILSIVVCIIAFLLIFIVLPMYGLLTFLVFKASVEWFIALPIAAFLSMRYIRRQSGCDTD